LISLIPVTESLTKPSLVSIFSLEMISSKAFDRLVAVIRVKFQSLPFCQEYSSYPFIDLGSESGNAEGVGNGVEAVMVGSCTPVAVGVKDKPYP
jgi:hypothetical protein